MIEDVQRLQTSIGKLQENSANQIARLEEELEHKRQLIIRLEARLDMQRDYEDLKRQLRYILYCSLRLSLSSVDISALQADYFKCTTNGKSPMINFTIKLKG